MKKTTLSLEERQKIEKTVHNAKTHEDFLQCMEDFIQKPKTRPTKYHKKQRAFSIKTTSLISISPNEALSECCISDWLFGPAPVLHQAPKSFEYFSVQPISIEPQQRRSFDTGAFINDPVLISLRSRLNYLKSQK